MTSLYHTVFARRSNPFARKTAHRIFSPSVDIVVYQQHTSSGLLNPITFMMKTAVSHAVISSVFDDFHGFFACF